MRSVTTGIDQLASFTISWKKGYDPITDDYKNYMLSYEIYNESIDITLQKWILGVGLRVLDMIMLVSIVLEQYNTAQELQWQLRDNAETKQQACDK